MNRPSIILATGWAAPSMRLSDFEDHLSAQLGHAPIPFDLATVNTEPANQAGMSAYANALCALLNAQAEPSLVIGWSTGALIALETACCCPDKIRSLALISPTACFCAQRDYPHGPKPAAVRAMIAGLRTPRRNRIITDFAQQAAIPATLTEEEMNIVLDDALSQGEETLINGLTYLMQTDLRARIDRIEVPALILHGVEDQIIPVAAAQWLCDHLNHAQYRLLQGQGHHLPVRVPEALAQHILAFERSILEKESTR